MPWRMGCCSRLLRLPLVLCLLFPIPTRSFFFSALSSSSFLAFSFFSLISHIQLLSSSLTFTSLYKKMPPLPKLNKTQRTILFKLLQLLIVLVTLTLVGYVVSYLDCRNTQFEVALPPASAIVMFAIPLFWLLPVYLATTVISPYLLSRQSIYGHRPYWLTPKVRYFSIAIPALVTFGLAIYTVQPAYTQMFDSEELADGISDDRKYCRQWYPQPYLAITSSFLVLIETYINYRFDIQLPPRQKQQKPVTDTCENPFCFHACVSSVIHKNLSSQSPIASTNCSTVRLLRKIRIVASVAGTLVGASALALLFGWDEYALSSSKFYSISAHIIALILWLHVVISTVRPTVTRPALDLHPVLRFVFTLLQALALLIWTVPRTISFFSLNHCQDGWCAAEGAYSVVGVLFSFLMVLEAIWTFKFDRRRYNTARKVQLHNQQSQHGGVELVDIIDDGKFQERESYDGKIEASG